MRLVCPNCDAQYEVDANAVPEAGRDVQCSNCGHTWFQVPPDVEAELDADRALYGRIKNQLTDQPDAADAATQAVSEPDVPTRMSPKRVQAEAARTPAPAEKPAEKPATRPAEAPAVRRGLDESLLAVLREEAERETAVRRSETPRSLETQSDLGLEDTSAAGNSAKAVRDRLSRIRGDAPEQEVTRQPTSRRDLLPDIEEINSTLRASTENRESRASVRPEAELQPARASNGFRSGFSLMLLLSVMALFAYVAAPRISEQIPALEAPLNNYVKAINNGRLWVDSALQKATAGLQDMTGTADK
jgi:predicted Zn finger-like uncharacterized protein